jgi:hypothetical protein
MLVGPDGDVEIVDLLGRVVLRDVIEGGSVAVDLSPGVYFVRIGAAVTRIVVRLS